MISNARLFMRNCGSLLVACALACSSAPDASEERQAGFFQEYAELQCALASECGCPFGYASEDECRHSVSSKLIAQDGYYDGLAFNSECADRRLNVVRRHGCSQYLAAWPACSIHYGTVEAGEPCDAKDECISGHRCLYGECRSWTGRLGSQCEYSEDCDDFLLCLDGACDEWRSAGDECVSDCGMAWLTCTDGVCRGEPPTCGASCAGDENCVGGECIKPKENGAPCTENWECRALCHPYDNVCAEHAPLVCHWIVGWGW
jgi:hypothetical protein